MAQFDNAKFFAGTYAKAKGTQEETPKKAKEAPKKTAKKKVTKK